ncbi:hypothetical protein [Nocardioides sp. B-3]|uniref:hypothetical protein n=1 Tax=Nocardioides sp. B-3 TaxID=2895565 RepID=UPI002153378D|nr:hypothetical protein [Nocardioides sp. B-3]UUZ60526.1 hypothetical protein LP418_06550 [Nocardioides sp. B-3]
MTNDLEESSNASASTQQVTVLEPAIAYLTVAEEGMVAAQSTTGTSQNELDDALVEIKDAAAELLKARDDADLTPGQSRQVDVILDLSRSLRDEATGPVSPGTGSPSSARCSRVSPSSSPRSSTSSSRPSRDSSSSRRRSVVVSRSPCSRRWRRPNAPVAPARSPSSPSWAPRAPRSTVSPASSVTPRGSIRALRTNNGERTLEVRTGGTTPDLGGADAYDDYDKLQATLLDGVDRGAVRQGL